MVKQKDRKGKEMVKVDPPIICKISEPPLRVPFKNYSEEFPILQLQNNIDRLSGNIIDKPSDRVLDNKKKIFRWLELKGGLEVPFKNYAEEYPVLQLQNFLSRTSKDEKYNTKLLAWLGKNKLEVGVIVPSVNYDQDFPLLLPRNVIDMALNEFSTPLHPHNVIGMALNESSTHLVSVILD